MDMWQRCIAVIKADFGYNRPLTDDELVGEMKRLTFQKAIVPFLVLFFAWFSIGLAMKFTGLSASSSSSLTDYLKAAESLGPVGIIIESVIVLVCFSAIASTVDTFLVCLTQTFMYDIYGTGIVPGLAEKVPSLDESRARRFVRASRQLIVLLGISTIVLAFTPVFNYAQFWTSMYSVMLALLPPVLLRLKNEATGSGPTRSGNSILAAIILGATAALVFGIGGTFIWKSSLSVSLSPLAAVVVSAVVMAIGKKP